MPPDRNSPDSPDPLWNQQAQALWGSIRAIPWRAKPHGNCEGTRGGRKRKIDFVVPGTQARLWGATAKTQCRGPTPGLGLDDLIGLGAVEAVHVERPL
jgi:hypothetical protein